MILIEDALRCSSSSWRFSLSLAAALSSLFASSSWHLCTNKAQGAVRREWAVKSRPQYNKGTHCEFLFPRPAFWLLLGVTDQQRILLVT